MKVLLLNAWDTSGGAARAAVRLLRGLRADEIQAQMLVKKKNNDDPAILGPRTKLDKAMSYIRPSLENRRVHKLPGWNGLTFSPALFPDRLFHQVSELSPDIIHMHWMGDGFLRVETLPRFNCPLVWTLHDSWVFTGGCHIPLDCTRYRQSCGACPTLGSNLEHDLSRNIWSRKRKSWGALNLTLIAPSHWMADCARSSSLFHNARIVVIPNALDLHVYKPLDKFLAREALGLPKDKKLILFGAKSAIHDKNKGFHLLAGALRILAKSNSNADIELVVFGISETNQELTTGIKTHKLGWFHDDMSLAILYAAADVFVLPSISENLSYTVMEAMACGTPCVAFRQGGVPDLIDHEQNGYLAPPYDTSGLANGIAWILEDKERLGNLSMQARQKVERECAMDKITQRHVSLYKELLG
ncbi:MAG TPA: glycosyltransferase family 4 protein [Syntrophales bacterium]|nr:glycosyltransferase family 4 protein [Syntrophales bacterium]